MNSQATKTKQASLTMLPQFIMSVEDISLLHSLPDNMPDISLTQKQKGVVNDLYYKYISGNKVFYGWGRDLYELELKEKWPSGGRVKQHEAKRMILGWLRTYNDYYKELTGKKALEFLFNELSCREADQVLIKNIYEIK